MLFGNVILRASQTAGDALDDEPELWAAPGTQRLSLPGQQVGV